MPKRSYSTSDIMQSDGSAPPAKAQKSGRSHEENQERAYIAASRRADRSIEARVQSARMASEIHKRRTGRALKVSEEIVLKEEMYEEVEDDIPRGYRNLTAHLQTGSPELNMRISALVAARSANSAAASRYHEINRLFSEAFPRTHSFPSLYPSSFVKNMPPSPVVSQPAPSQAVSPPASRQHSISAQPQDSNAESTISSISPTSTPTTVSVPTPGLSPASAATEMTEPAGFPCQMTPSPFSNMPLDPQLLQQSTHPLNSEVHGEMKMMTNMDMNDPMAMQFYGGDVSSGYPGMFDQFDDMSYFQFAAPEQGDCSVAPFEDLSTNRQGECIPPDTSRFGTPNFNGPGMDAWESLVDFGTEQ
ncbi:hypothetical protein F5Y17DRAFT_257477 [Xylariaceae sp. FL0594]|nr:hypothetical protein F5Y17DRAFT_257477 [Xylariaceae sp. FL0594]